jgi:hypothetical protein
MVSAHFLLRKKPGFPGLRMATYGCPTPAPATPWLNPQSNCLRQLLNPLRASTLEFCLAKLQKSLPQRGNDSNCVKKVDL